MSVGLSRSRRERIEMLPSLTGPTVGDSELVTRLGVDNETRMPLGGCVIGSARCYPIVFSLSSKNLAVLQ